MEAQDIRLRTKRFAVRVVRVAASLPQNNVGWTLGRQLLRSGTSIGANCREAVRASSRKHFISINEIALREADETLYWLELLVQAGIVAEVKVADLMNECNELISIFVTLVKSTKRPPSNES